RAFGGGRLWRLLRRAAVRAELGSWGIRRAALRARDALRLRRAAALLRVLLLAAERAGHHLAIDHAEAEAHALARGAALLLGRVLNGLRRLELHVSAHVADGAHARTLIDHLLHFFGRRDGRDDEVDQLKPLLAEVFGDARFQTGGQLIVISRQIEDRLQVFAEQVVEPRHGNVAQERADGFGRNDAARADDRGDEQLRIGNPQAVLAERPQPHKA